MILDAPIKIAHYKCFDSIAQGFEKIYPINIIIGKNNSGKSSLIDLIEFVNSPKGGFIAKGRDKSSAEVILSGKIEESFTRTSFLTGQNSGMHNYPTDFEYGKSLIDKTFQYHLDESGHAKMISPGNLFVQQFVNIGDRAAQESYNQLQIRGIHKIFKRINAERNISIERVGEKPELSIDANGAGATLFVRQIITKNNYDANLIQKTLLEALNEIVSPDIRFTSIMVQEEAGNVNWEIYLSEESTRMIPLSKMGSGVKTIILVLLQMLVVPEVEERSKNEYIFAFEELENNLHPSLLRRLFNYIAAYANANQAIFFITTHSSIVIDLFGSNANAQLIHVVKNSTISTATTVISNDENRKILRDLEAKPSDLLLTNGIIWVEGPSDVIYLELLFKLFVKEYPSTILNQPNYTIQSLSPSIWKYAGFDNKVVDFNNVEFQNKVISLAKINHNHILIIDNDNNYEDLKPSDWESFKNKTGQNKARLIYESMKFSNHPEIDLETNFGNSASQKLFFWITPGTFESYLEHFINNIGRTTFQIYFDRNATGGYLEKRRSGENSSISKVELAIQIANYCLDNNISFLEIAPSGSELHRKVERMFNTIQAWN